MSLGSLHLVASSCPASAPCPRRLALAARSSPPRCLPPRQSCPAPRAPVVFSHALLPHPGGSISLPLQRTAPMPSLFIRSGDGSTPPPRVALRPALCSLLRSPHASPSGPFTFCFSWKSSVAAFTLLAQLFIVKFLLPFFGFFQGVLRAFFLLHLGRYVSGCSRPHSATCGCTLTYAPKQVYWGWGCF